MFILAQDTNALAVNIKRYLKLPELSFFGNIVTCFLFTRDIHISLSELNVYARPAFSIFSVAQVFYQAKTKYHIIKHSANAIILKLKNNIKMIFLMKFFIKPTIRKQTFMSYMYFNGMRSEKEKRWEK